MHPSPLLDDFTWEVSCSIPSAVLKIFSSWMKICQAPKTGQDETTSVHTSSRRGWVIDFIWLELPNCRTQTSSYVCKKRYTCLYSWKPWSINLFFLPEHYFVCFQFLFSGQEVDKLRQMCKPFRKRKVVTTLFFSVQITLTVFPYFSVGTICQQGVVPNLT